MAKGFVVVEVGFEYNDEIYHQSESGGGEPIKMFIDKAKALELVNKKNIEAFSSNNIFEYAYESSDILNNPEVIQKICSKYPGCPDLNDDSYEFGEWLQENIKSFSEKDRDAIMEDIGLKFYTLSEVEFDDTIAIVQKPTEDIKEKKTKKKFSNM